MMTTAIYSVQGRVSTLEVVLTRVRNSVIKATIINHAADPVLVFRPGSLLDERPIGKSTSRHAKEPVGHEARFIGQVVPMDTEQWNRDSFQKISRGKPAEAVFDVAEIYDISATSEYRIKASGLFMTKALNIDVYRYIPFTSNILKVVINGAVASATSRASYAMRAKFHASCAGGKARAVVAALHNCVEFAVLGRRAAEWGSSVRLLIFFGRADQEVRKMVAKVFARIEAGCSNLCSEFPRIDCFDRLGQCGPRTLAYANGSGFWLCESFFDLPERIREFWEDDQLGVIVHEMAHVLHPQLTDYGYRNAVLSIPEAETLRNVDNYLYFARSAAYY
ncbi:deuterolysin metalloprotease (M35) family domain-containing protein [Purpureocillium lavendulum]|uniref:deuterolysin n=1 Tax=Purpureocillium lavendulum TaxID=1247861 RepID=A0AB34FLY4_9HYPO|nr:deuterolysin metalloprotease (M35) family domain-containing protein [Purpureocillium lavendulum]